MIIKISKVLLFVSIVSITALLNVEVTYAQTASTVADVAPIDTGKIYMASECTEVASFPGGDNAFIKFLKSTVKYPVKAILAEKQGKVLVEVLVEKDGELTNIKVTQEVGYGLDEEAVRVLKLMPKWIPSRVNGVTVRSKLVITIPFTISVD